jgi:hypothetical protein
MKDFWGNILCPAFIQIRNALFSQNSNPSDHHDIVLSIHAMDNKHETARLLQQLINTIGAGTWPPKASHGETWPAALRPYHGIYLELAPSISCEVLDPEDIASGRRVHTFRERMRQLLKDRVELPVVKTLLAAEDGIESSILPAEIWNGFYACIALSRHAFR